MIVEEDFGQSGKGLKCTDCGGLSYLSRKGEVIHKTGCPSLKDETWKEYMERMQHTYPTRI